MISLALKTQRGDLLKHNTIKLYSHFNYTNQTMS